LTRRVESALAVLRDELLNELRHELLGHGRSRLETTTIGFAVRDRRGARIELGARPVSVMRVFRLCIDQEHAEGWQVRRVVCGNMPLTPGVEPIPARAFTPLPHWALDNALPEVLAAELARIPVENIITCGVEPGLELRIELEHEPSFHLGSDGTFPTVPPPPTCWMLAHVPKHIG
jgi:hypothetical protein